MLELNIYRNTNDQSEAYNKYYPRVDYKEEMDIPALAKHMAEHNTPFSPGTIAGILTDAAYCIREQTLNGKTVKIDNLAIFKCSVEGNGQTALYTQAKGAIRAAIGPKNSTCAVKSVKLLAQATGDYRKQELNGDVTLGWTKAAEELIDKARQAAIGG
jgi:hypothetical protein